MAAAGPERIAAKFVARPWGSHDLSPLYESRAEKTGEVWFEADPLLVKFIFTSEHLSIQVHPDDAYAAKHENGKRGKTEMWHILHAEAGARIAVGFRDRVTRKAAEQACLDGSIVDMLIWHEALPGDTFYTPSGTVHAIGAGLVLCEIQQHSDVTYRLYDWGRLPPRPLHLDQGLAVADLGPHPGRSAPNGEVLVRSPYFVVERAVVEQDCVWPRDSLMIVLEGRGTIDGVLCQAGEVWRAPAGTAIRAMGAMTVLRTYVET